MKKTMRALLLALVLVLSLLALVACGHEHSFGEAWSHDGSHHWHAPTCEHEKAEDMPAGQDYSTHTMVATPENDTAPTCGKAGTSTTECQVCGFKKVETLPPTGEHSYGGDVVYTEADANGLIYSQKQCTVCGKKGAYLHIFDGKWSTDAENHWHSPTCRCEGEDAPGNIDIGAHDFAEAVTVKPTCTKDGTTTKTCGTCKFTVTLETVPALGHTETVSGYIADGITVSAKLSCSTCRATRNVKVEGAKVVTDTTTAQDALDAAEEGTLIYFAKANYDTLSFRATEENGVAYDDLYYREFKNITLIAHADATFRGFVTGSLTDAVALTNVTFSGLTFTGEETALLFDGLYKIDGLTVDGCTVKRTDALEAGEQPYLLVTAAGTASFTSADGEWSFVTSRKNITVKNCKVEGLYGMVKLLGTENVTLAGNSLRKLAAGAIRLDGDAPYTGTVAITDNVAAFGLGDRFLYATGLQNTEFILTGNTVSGYDAEAPADIVKVENSTLAELTNENNTFPKDKTVVLPTPAPAE